MDIPSCTNFITANMRDRIDRDTRTQRLLRYKKEKRGNKRQTYLSPQTPRSIFSSFQGSLLPLSLLSSFPFFFNLYTHIIYVYVHHCRLGGMSSFYNHNLNFSPARTASPHITTTNPDADRSFFLLV